MKGQHLWKRSKINASGKEVQKRWNTFAAITFKQMDPRDTHRNISFSSNHLPWRAEKKDSGQLPTMNECYLKNSTVIGPTIVPMITQTKH